MDRVKKTLENASMDTAPTKGGSTGSDGSKNPWVNAIVGGLSIGANLFNTWRTNQSNRSLTTQQNAENRAMWMLNNFYNSPEQQIARLKAAGLNPAMLYGSGIENTSDSAPEMQASRDQQAPAIDPLTMAQINNLNAQTESIEHQTDRDDERQEFDIEEIRSRIDNARQTIKNLQQQLANLSLDQQIKQYEILHREVEHEFENATFFSAVRSAQLSVKRLQSLIEGDYAAARWNDEQVRRSMILLPWEVSGFDINQKNVKSLTSLNWQQYNQSKELFQWVQGKAKWDAKNAEEQAWKTKSEKELTDANRTLKELEFWIEARDNPLAYESFSSDGHILYSSPVTQFMTRFSDLWNHGISLPLRIGFSGKLK